MADQLYLSLWFPNFRLAGLAPALVSVIRQFGAVGGSSRVAAATAYPISRTESPAYQRIYSENELEESIPELAVAAATELLHDDFAYEFDLIWELWSPEVGGGLDPVWKKEPAGSRSSALAPSSTTALMNRMAIFGSISASTLRFFKKRSTSTERPSRASKRMCKCWLHLPTPCSNIAASPAVYSGRSRARASPRNWSTACKE